MAWRRSKDADRSGNKPVCTLCRLTVLWVGSVLWLGGADARQYIETFWADLPPVNPITARELANARSFIAYMAQSSFSLSGELDLRYPGARTRPNIDVRDKNLKSAIIEASLNDDEAANKFVINDFVDRHIERVQVNSILLARLEVQTQEETIEYKLHSLGCRHGVTWLRWSLAWNLDYIGTGCKIFYMRDVGSSEEEARISPNNNTIDGDPDGFVNTEVACIQSRALNNFDIVQKLQSNTSDMKISRYAVGGDFPFYIDLESFYEHVREQDIRFHEVRYTSRYSSTSESWSYYGHRSFPPQNETDFNSSFVAESRRRGVGDCAKHLLLDRRRIRSKAVDKMIEKGQEVLLDSGIELPPQTSPTSVLTAAVSSVVAAVSTTPIIGDKALEWLKPRGCSQAMNLFLALSVEFFSELAFAIPLHMVVVNEAQRLRSDTVQSIVFITTTEYENAPGLSSMTAGGDVHPYHLVNMVQASRKANTDMFILGLTLECAFLIFAIIYVLSFRLRAMRGSQKSRDKMDLIQQEELSEP